MDSYYHRLPRSSSFFWTFHPLNILHLIAILINFKCPFALPSRCLRNRMLCFPAYVEVKCDIMLCSLVLVYSPQQCGVCWTEIRTLEGLEDALEIGAPFECQSSVAVSPPRFGSVPSSFRASKPQWQCCYMSRGGDLYTPCGLFMDFIWCCCLRLLPGGPGLFLLSAWCFRYPHNVWGPPSHQYTFLQVASLWFTHPSTSFSVFHRNLSCFQPLRCVCVGGDGGWRGEGWGFWDGACSFLFTIF